MLGIVLLAVGCHFVGGLTLIIGMVRRNHRLQRFGMGLIALITMGLLGLAVAEQQPLPSVFPSRSIKLFK